jgi:predicted Zn-dependent peptidase
MGTSPPDVKPQSPVMGEDTKGSGDTKGSVVEYLTGDRSHSKYRADHGASNYHEHLAFNTTEERDSAISLLKSNGITIGSMNDGRHAPGSYHYVDRAFDVPLYPNIQNLGISDNKEGEEKFSAMVRKILYKGGFKGKGMGEGLTQSPATITPKQPPNKAQEVSSTTSYEETGLQVAILTKEVPVAMPLPGGGGGASSGGSRSSGGIDIDSIILGQSFSNA